MELIRRWQASNCLVKFDFASTDHSLEMNFPASLYARTSPHDDCAFWLTDATEHGRVHVKLTAADSYEIVDIQREAHPEFKLRVDYRFSLRVPYAEWGDLFIYEIDTQTKVM